MRILCRAILLFIFFWISRFCFSVSDPTIPNYTFINQDGKSFKLHSLKGKHLLLSFFTTECSQHNECFKTIALIKYTQYLVQSHPTTKLSFNFLFVSLDQKKDTPLLLSQFPRERGLEEKDFIFATSDEKTLAQLSMRYNTLTIPPKDGKPFRHTIKTILFDPELRKMKELLGATWSPANIAAVLP